MNALSKALVDLSFNIPKEILSIAFNDNPVFAVQSVDETILNQVIRPKILPDCNIVGGVQIYVDVDNCYVYDYSDNTMTEFVIDVPKPLTNNRSIIAPIGLFLGVRNAIIPSSDNPVLSALGQQMNAAAPADAIGTSRLELIGENKIVVTNPAAMFIGGKLKCVVENDSNLSNISPRSYITFSQLVTLGVKAYIYNHLIVKLGKGYIYNGHELGIVNEIISEYATANEEYYTFLRERWAVVAFHNDKERLSNHIKSML